MAKVSPGLTRAVNPLKKAYGRISSTLSRHLSEEMKSGILTGAAIGGAAGALYGFADKKSNPLESGLKGAAIGGGLGLGSGVWNSLGSSSPASSANQSMPKPPIGAQSSVPPQPRASSRPARRVAPGEWAPPSSAEEAASVFADAVPSAVESSMNFIDLGLTPLEQSIEAAQMAASGTARGTLGIGSRLVGKTGVGIGKTVPRAVASGSRMANRLGTRVGQTIGQAGSSLGRLSELNGGTLRGAWRLGRDAYTKKIDVL